MRQGKPLWGRAVAGLAALGLALAGQSALAHPMGNFSISHYTRIEARGDSVAIRYLLDFAEIPTVSEKSAMDTDRNSSVSDTERAAYLQAKAATLRNGLSLTVDGTPVTLEVRPVSLAFRPGAGGLDTLLLTLDLSTALPGSGPQRIAYRDGNFTERTGWKEIVAVAGTGATISQASVPATDRSKALTAYPTDASIAPPQETEATFTLSAGAGGWLSSLTEPRAANPTASGTTNTPKDAFTQAIAVKKLTPGIILLSLGLAFVFGAFHALSPGHGKAMVAAYLVGARGTAKHAVFLGAVVTVTHTIGVFALGIVTLIAAQYVVPERLYPILSALSGIAIVGIGLTLMRQRLLALMPPHPHSHDHAHPHAHSHSHDHDDTHSHDHDHHHGHEHSHTHDHAHDSVYYHDHGDGHVHSHHVPDDMPISFKTLLILGITGGALPCPSALVVMLGAIALHRVAFGLALISAFSLGLAVVLTAIGLLVVYARGFLERLPINGRLVSRLPVVSAALVTVIGIVLVVRAFSGNF